MLAGICRVDGSNSFHFVLLFEVTSVSQSVVVFQFPARLEPVNWPQKSLLLPVVSLRAISRILTQKLTDLMG